MSEKMPRAGALAMINAALGVWLGVYAFRTFVPAAVWNLSDDLPLQLKGVIALGVHALAISGCFLPITRGARAGLFLAATVAVLGVSRQILLASDTPGALLSLLCWIAWAWWLAAFAQRIDRDHAHLMGAGFVLGFILQVGMQAAFRGLDLPMSAGIAAVAGAVLLNAAFVWTTFMLPRTAGPTGGTGLLVALGAAFFLEVTLLANVGRIAYAGNLEIVPAALVIQAGLIVGLIIVSTTTSRFVTVLSAVALTTVTALAPRFGGASVVLFAIANAGLVALLGRTAARPLLTARRAAASGLVLLFALVFLFYNRYEWPLLWPVAALLIALIALPGPDARRTSTLIPLIAMAGVLLALAGTPVSAGRPVAGEPDGRLSILTYNIRQGFDAAGAPAMQRIAAEIERTGADVVALQEIGRGWTFVGGADLVGYLKARFPAYQIHYVPVNGQLWGVALMSRLPMTDRAGAAFDAAAGVFRYGYAAATVHYHDAPVRIASVHMTAGIDVDGGGARAAEVEQLLHAAGNAADAIIAGDLNALPDEPPVQRLLAAGFVDAGAAAGLSELETWPAHAPNQRIDYVFSRGDFAVESGAINRTNASDHLPVFVRLKRRPR